MRLSVLEAAQKLLAQGEEERALERLVECWRAWKATELADTIDQFAARLSSTLPPVTGGGTTSDRQAWLAVAADHRTATLPRLFEVVAKTNGPIARERLESLAAWPASPTLSSQLARLLEQPPFDGKSRGRCFPPALQVLEAQADPRVVPLLKRLAAVERRSQTIRDLGLSSWKPIQALAKRAAGWPPPPLPDAAETSALQRLRERFALRPSAHPTVKLEELYAAVYAQPEDDTARLILADVLQEAGDPRGELIALQLGRAATGGTISKREKELLGTWARDWLGPLDPALMRQGIAFERGFLAQCAYNGQRLPRLNERPEWATVTHLEVAHSASYAGGSNALVVAPALKSLRHLHGVGSPADLRAIAEAGRPLPWETLSLKLWSLEAAGRAVLTAAPLPSLTALGLLGATPAPLSGLDESVLARIFEGPLGRSLRHLEVALAPALFGALIDFAGTRKLTSITIRPSSRALCLRFDVAPRAVVIGFDPISEDAMEVIVAALRSARRGTFDRVLLKLGQRAKLAGSVLQTAHARVSLKALKQAAGEAELVLPG
ncbi:MAG: hypothetical protein H6Q89_5378 [Myxococcaceae bacterium]|nr:hypothetical protein [Myxococcaceae bacterium]